MKRTHLKIGMIAAGMAILTAGCTPESDMVTLGARIDNKGYSKVHIDNGTPTWDKNDQIRVNDQTLVIEPVSGTVGQLTKVTGNSFYRAIYPADIVKNEDLSEGNTVAVTLPPFSELSDCPWLRTAAAQAVSSSRSGNSPSRSFRKSSASSLYFPGR